MLRVTDRGQQTLIDIANVSDRAVFRAIPAHRVVCRYRVTDPTHDEVWHVEHRRAESPMVLVRKALAAAPQATLVRTLDAPVLGCQAWLVPYGIVANQRCLNDFVVREGTAIVGHSSTFRPDVGGAFRKDPPGDHQVWFYCPVAIPPHVAPMSLGALRAALVCAIKSTRR